MVASRSVRRTQTPSAAAQLESTRLRLTFLTLLVVSLFALLFARLWFLQVMAGERYTTLAEGNAVRTMEIAAPRGKLLDRHGKPLVRNRYAMVVSVQPREMGDRRGPILHDLARLLGLPRKEVERRIETSTVSPFRPKPVAVDVPADIVFYIHENGSTRYPGVYAESLPVRDYRHGQTAAHVLGYLGEISQAELDSPEFVDYQPGDQIGWSGLERSYEQVLQGRDGMRRFEVNATGDIVGELPTVLPVAGADVRTTLDLKAQKLAERALEGGIRRARKVPDSQSGRGPYFKAPAGAAVVLEPDGSVVAMASYPTFSPERFVGGVSTRYWRWLQDPDNHFPLINRAVQSSYPPGSVFKIVSAAAALEGGYMTTTSRLPCPGSWEWAGQVFRNWNPGDSGSLDMTQALSQSCDTVFYELAQRMWTDEQREGDEPSERLAEMSRAFGLGEPTGVELPGDKAGVVPGRAWKQAFWEDNRDAYCTQARRAPESSYARDLFTDLCERGNVWRGGDAVNMSIGQGDVQTTPLQIANAFAAAANGGTLYRPRLGAEVVSPDGGRETLDPEVVRRLPVSAKHLRTIRRGLEMVTSEGTASATFGDFPVPVAGKTGTAELKPKQPFAWFAAYAPADDPRYIVVTMVEEGGGGSLNAAPIARRILEGLLDLGTTAITPGETTD